MDMKNCPNCNPGVFKEFLTCGSCKKNYILGCDDSGATKLKEIQKDDSYMEEFYQERSKKKLLVWKEYYTFGIPKIDEQHHNIFNLINDIYDAVSSEDKRKKGFIPKILTELDVFVKEHFTYEEKILKAMNFPDMNSHLAEHRIFIQNLKNMHQEYSNSFFDLRNVLTFLQHWFLEHTVVVDRHYVEFWKGKMQEGKIAK